MTRFFRYLGGALGGYMLLTLWPEGWPRPDPLLLALAQMAWRKASPAKCALLGVAGGLGMAMLGPGPAGLFVAVYGWTGLLLGLLGERDEREGFLAPALLVALGTGIVALGLAGLGSLSPLGPAPARIQLWFPGALLMNFLFWFGLLKPAPIRERRVRIQA